VKPWLPLGEERAQVSFDLLEEKKKYTLWSQEHRKGDDYGVGVVRRGPDKENHTRGASRKEFRFRNQGPEYRKKVRLKEIAALREPMIQ